jgi:hypothetical protein
MSSRSQPVLSTIDVRSVSLHFNSRLPFTTRGGPMVGQAEAIGP